MSPFFLQIGIQEAAPSPRPLENGSAYYTPPLRDAPPPYYSQETGHFTDITSMFLGSSVANGIKVLNFTLKRGTVMAILLYLVKIAHEKYLTKNFFGHMKLLLEHQEENIN